LLLLQDYLFAGAPDGAGALEGAGAVDGAGAGVAGGAAGAIVPAPLPVVVGWVVGGAEPVVAGAVVDVGALATLLPLLAPPQPAHHQTPMPIATSTMMPMIQAPELSSRTRRVLLFGS
jgi:hypothetical protein